MLEKITKTLIENAKKQSEESLDNAKRELELELKKIITEGEAKIELSKEQAKKIVENERRERISWAKLEAKRIIAEAKEDRINAVLDLIFEKIIAYANTPEFTEQIKTRVLSALTEVGKERVIHVKKGRKKFFKIQDAEIKEDLEALEGAIVESSDGKIRITLTLEELFNTQRDALRKEVYTKLFVDK